MGVFGQIIEALRSEDLAGVDSDRLAESVVELRSELDQLEVEWTRRVAVLEPELSGHPSATAFLKDRCRMSGSRAQRAVVLAGRLAVMPFTTKAVESGDLSLDQVRVFSDLPERLSEDLSRDEVTLVNTVGGLSVGDTRRVLEYWKTAVDGPGAEATAAELFDRRYLFGSKNVGRDGQTRRTVRSCRRRPRNDRFTGGHPTSRRR